MSVDALFHPDAEFSLKFRIRQVIEKLFAKQSVFLFAHFCIWELAIGTFVLSYRVNTRQFAGLVMRVWPADLQIRVGVTNSVDRFVCELFEPSRGKSHTPFPTDPPIIRREKIFSDFAVFLKGVNFDLEGFWQCTLQELIKWCSFNIGTFPKQLGSSEL